MIMERPVPDPRTLRAAAPLASVQPRPAAHAFFESDAISKAVERWLETVFKSLPVA